MLQQSLVESSPAYMSLYDDSVKLPLDKTFPVSCTTFRDYETEPLPKDHEEDHQYDIIPATLLDYDNIIQKSVDGCPQVDDVAAKTDSVPQI